MPTKVRIETNRGDIIAELFSDDAINTVKNFVTLAQKGYYDGLTFHRVVPDFVIQGGDPVGDGTGGPGYAIPCETRGHRQKHKLGALSMAHAGRDTGGSQFFIVLSEENTKHLNGKHTVFGQTVEGMDVVKAIRQGDTMIKVEVLEVDPAIESHELKTLKSWR
ncbi:MAG: peptidylprolyl isomerase [Candidatus Thorarchaeota archaeon]|nr:MAG: peptidylprolyl isomerase [Candidatus Thorarchaeota archaeon]RLI60197.1 MAG: peptidylprolyl isomerase [Candidatus Thorarchaeota archaeon]